VKTRPLLLSWVFLLMAFASCKESAPKVVRNHCSTDGECSGASRCDEGRALCVADEVETPYLIALQVANKSPTNGKVRRHTFEPFMLTKSDTSADFTIPVGVTASGFVGALGMDGNRVAVRAELTFMPMSDHEGAPVAPVVATCRDSLDAMDGTNLRVTLATNTRYEVTAIPLGDGSTRLPPAYFSFDTKESARFDFVFPEVEPFRGFVLDEMGTALEDLWVRVVHSKTRTVLSSIGIVGKDGKLELFVNPSVLGGDDYHFEVSLDPARAWDSVIEVDPSRVDAEKDNTLVLPVVPRFVRFRGIVEKSADVRLSSADLTFVSDFPIPNVPGEVGNRDFCRSTIPGDVRPPFRCRSVRRGTTGDNGRFEVALLPGDYRVFLSPATDGENVNRATTLAGTAVIETQAADGPQRGQVYMLETGLRYQGMVRAPDGSPVENVLVRAVALGVVGYLDEVAAYNRPSETVTDEDGRFNLAVDVGLYDLVARPAVTSGYPWVYVANRVVNVKDGPLEVASLLPIPVLLAGTLKEDGQVAAGASVDAFALVPGEGGRRAVPIARTTTDEQGRYTLLLSPNRPLDARAQSADAGAE